MPSDLTLKTMNVVHRALMKVTGGRVGARVGTMPALELTTVGRRSGQQRSVMLTAPLVLGDTLVVVASRGGDDVHPAWYLNLRDNPEVLVAVSGGERRAMSARAASPQEREDLWPRVVEDWPLYGKYQTRTTREIPLVLLEPREAAAA
ncbi:nitroreductase/quinone reductase family protein [Oerskovia flava]|uniref:nitroreductase/quinone reductase family protein n=1 Tax=Oerskovia flava TaxID=2986422 RepID=UPI002240CA88|nr:nitroreductase/quinone reductase family protein [Oerskovia sp. JB1-3-2]